MTGAFIVLSLLAEGFFVALFAAARAPQGYEDATGFHYGPEPTESNDHFEDAAAPVSSAQPAGRQ